MTTPKYRATDLEKPEPSKLPPPKPTRVQSRTGFQYPWAEIVSEYVTGYIVPDARTGAKVHIYPTLDELAEKYGCSPHYIKLKSSKESWSKRREFFQLKRQEQTEANRFHSVLSESASSDARTLLAVDKLYALVEAYFEQYENMEMCDDGKFRLRNHRSKLDEEAEDPIKEIKVQDLKGLVEVLDRAQALVRRTVGEPINHNQYQYQDLVNSGVFGEEKTKEKVDTLLNKRSNIKKTKEEVRKEIEELQVQLEE